MSEFNDDSKFYFLLLALDLFFYNFLKFRAQMNKLLNY